MTGMTVRNLVRSLTIRRVFNLFLVFLSYRISIWTRRSIVWGRPYTLTIEPTNRCNLLCPECPSGNGAMTRPLGTMSMETFRRIVDEVAPEVFYLQLFFQGEPFINKHLVEMIAHAHERGMYVGLSTNAHFISARVAEDLMAHGLERLIVSIDGMTQETYEEYRVGGKLERVFSALDLLTDARNRRNGGNRTEVILQFLVTRGNEGEIPAVRELGKTHDAHVALKTMQVYSVESARQFLPDDEKYRRYRIVDGRLVPKSRMKNRCVRLWERSVITWDGVVVPCCFDKNAEYSLGNISEDAFGRIWQSDTYHGFRRRILENRKGVPLCTNCTEGLKVYR